MEKYGIVIELSYRHSIPMSRPLRIAYEGAWYHVMNRGAGKRKIFHNNAHRQVFLNLLHQIHNRYQIQLHAYCLMDNHYHLLIRTPLPNISRAMRHLDGVYTQRYNKIQQTDGSLLRGRFKSIVVDAENYLLRLSRYIHLNPVAGGLVKKAEQYYWSSYAAYLNPKLTPRWLTTSDILGRFGNNLCKQKYKLFVEEGVDKELDTFFKKIKRLPILGAEAFISTISEKYLDNNKDTSSEISEQKSLKRLTMPSLEQIIIEVTKYYRVDLGYIKNSVRGKRNRARELVIYLAYTKAGLSMQTIAKFFGSVSYSAISKIFQRLQREIASDEHLDSDITSLIRRLSSNSQLQT